MEAYIGTKIVLAESMTAEQFHVATGITVRGAKSDDDAGYKVVYEDGYVSWSPRDVFERSYRRITAAERALL